MTTCGLSINTLQQLQSVFAQYPEITEVILYGSRAKGNYKLGSDIDLTIVSSTLSHQQLLKIENQIDDLLLPYSVDLCLFRTIEHIQRVGIRFSALSELP
jgi:predicted nucleotidyltransferase